MPPWGRPPGGRAGVGRYMEGVDDVYRFQELESDDEKNGVLLEPGYQQVSNGKHFNPDELYFNDMDIRAWERRSAAVDGMAYGDDYGYLEDEGYYDDAGEVTMSAAEYEELLFQRVLDKIRLARATGDADVQLTPEELEAYQSRLLRPRAPAARPQARVRPVSAPTVNAATSSAIINTSSNVGASNSGSARSKKSERRTSIFASRPKKEKSSSRKRAPSNVSDATNQPPGFVVPGPGGQPIYAPINAYQGRMARDATPVRSSSSPSRPGSRSASISSRQGHAQTPPRATPPREIPGAFPSGSPQKYRASTPPWQGRPPSSSSRQSTHDNIESPMTRSRSSSIQQPTKLVPFPVTDYQHYTAEPYQYHVPGQPPSSQPSSSAQPQYARRVVSGPADSNYMTMPRRVPVPVQRAAPMGNAQGSYSDPALGQRGSRAEVGEEDEGQGGILVDVSPTDDKSYKVQTVKPSTKEGSNGGSNRDSERRRRSGRSRRKN